MAPLPYNNTSILRVLYAHTDFGEREMLFRARPGVTSGDLVETVSDFIQVGIAPLWSSDVTVTGGTWQEAGADFSLPIAVPAIAGENGGVVTATNVPRFASVNGRGITTGREYKVGFYFGVFAIDTNYRYTLGENPQMDTLINAFGILSASLEVCTIGGDQMQRRTYANVGYNAYWQRKLRKS